MAQAKSTSRSKSKPMNSAPKKALMSSKTVDAKSKSSTPKLHTDDSIHGFARDVGVLSQVKVQALPKGKSRTTGIDGEFHIFGSKTANAEKLEKELFVGDIENWQQNYLDQRANESFFLQTKRAPVWILRCKQNGIIKGKAQKLLPKNHYGLTTASSYAQMRDRVGAHWHSLKDAQGVTHLGIYFHGCTEEEVKGALVGMEVACYRFQVLTKPRASKNGNGLRPSFKISAFGASEKILKDAKAIGESVNLARHLVNLDAAKLNPATYSEFVLKWFKRSKSVKVDVWGPEKLLKENMNLIYGVGQGAVHQSHMVHIKYRPQGKGRLKNPIAFVGKGVTFDTGGLDIKPPSGMRLMKKDMGGSASVMGIAHWLVESKSDVPCDLYLALAENSVDQHSFRPGDVLIARNGLSVEIHNTDAEGRLVMADVLDVATTKTGLEAPCAVIDLSTLTGAMRVAVGTEIAGMFANHDALGDLALIAGAQSGDPAWRLPLWDSYKSQLRSSFADLANASDSGFGGAISAALFLQRFIRNETPWLHFDLFCWADRVQGPFGDIGGNGQGIQLMVELLERVNPRTLS